MAMTQNKNATAAHDGIFERANEAGEQFVGAARKAGSAYLDSYDKAVDRAIDFELKLAGSTQQEWLKGLIEAQADFTRQVTGTYTSSARTLLR